MAGAHPRRSAGVRRYLLGPAIPIDQLLGRPRASLRKDSKGQAGLVAGFAAGFAPGTDQDGRYMLVHAWVSLEAVGDLCTGFPDRIGPAMPGLASCRLIAPLQQVHEEHPQMALQRPVITPAHDSGGVRVDPSGKKSSSSTCSTVKGHPSGKT